MRRQVRNALIAVLLVAGIAASIATAVRQFAGGAQAPAQAAAASLFSGNAGSRMQASPPPVNGMTTARQAQRTRRRAREFRIIIDDHLRTAGRR